MRRFSLCLLVAVFFPITASAVPDFVKGHFGAEGGSDNTGYFVGEIQSAQPAGQYVYLQVKDLAGPTVHWVATQLFQARPGMQVRFRLGKPNKNFKSPSTGKIYPEIYLVQTIEVAKSDTATPECFLVKSLKDGDKVSLRGVVTKVNVGILGKNWVHIQDEKGRCLDLDLTATTDAEPKVGEQVEVVGTLRLNQAIGDGAYFFPVLIEDASFDKN